jgi:hypothetical protein
VEGVPVVTVVVDQLVTAAARIAAAIEQGLPASSVQCAAGLTRPISLKK